MSDRAEHRPAAPSRAEVEEKLRGLIEGRYSREAVTSWAEQWVMAKDPNVQDGAVWRALTALAGADLISTDRPYLYGREDFLAWLNDLQQAGS